jgi:hypothetical protein
LPLNYFLALKIGAVGVAITDLFTFTAYNFIRWLFLYRKFGLQPFNRKTVFTLVIAAAAYFICHPLFEHFNGLIWLILRSVTFILLMGAGILAFRLSEDVLPVWHTVRTRIQKLIGRDR